MSKIYNYQVIIFTEGGQESGYGHIMRCVSLYDELQSRHIRPVMVIQSDQDVSEVLEGRTHIIDSWYGNTKKYLSLKPYTITDSYIAKLSDYVEISNSSKKALFIDDTLRLDYPMGIVLNPSLFGSKLNYSKKPGQIYLTGDEYIILRKEFRKNYNRVTKRDIKKILIIMGGSDIRNVTPNIIKALVQTVDRSTEFHVVMGKGSRNFDEILAVSKNINCTIQYNLNAQDLRTLMSECDLAISAAGQTTNELIAMQLPFICLMVAQNQMNNISGLMEYGIIESFIDITLEDFHSESLIKSFIALSDLKERKKIASKMSSINLLRGTERIIDRLVCE